MEDFIGGEPVIDFSNTVTGRDMTPRDWLYDYAALADWAVLSKVIAEGERAYLEPKIRTSLAVAAKELRLAKDLREAVFCCLGAASRREQAPIESMSLIECEWKSAVSTVVLERGLNAINVRIPVERAGISVIRHRLALSSVALFSSDLHSRLKLCSGPNCAWYFLDHSKSGKRKWCSMKTCGNSAKARRWTALHRRPSDQTRC